MSIESRQKRKVQRLEMMIILLLHNHHVLRRAALECRAVYNLLCAAGIVVASPTS